MTFFFVLQHTLIILAFSFSYIGFMTDQLGDYIPSLYLAATVMITAGFVPFLLRCFKTPTAQKEGTVEVIEL